jgi:hypothetical protein
MALASGACKWRLEAMGPGGLLRNLTEVSIVLST